MIRMGVGFDDFIDKLTVEGIQLTKDLVEETLTDIADNAAAAWPVGSTGRSASSFHVRIDEGATKISGEIVNDSGYAPYINHGRTLHELVVVPFHTAVILLPGEILRLLSEID